MRIISAIPLFFPLLLASQPDLRFHLVDEADDMPLKDINCIAEDTMGFIWMGGPHGLYRWDGVSASFFSHDPSDPGSLTYGSISILQESRRGGLWVGTHRGGLSFLDFGTFKASTFQRDPNVIGSLAGNMISGIYEEPDGTLWVGTDRFALNRLDPDKDNFRVFQPPFPKDSAWTDLTAGPLGQILPDQLDPQKLWIGSKFGLYTFEKTTGRFQLFPFAKPTEYWYSSRQMELYLDPDGLLWVGTLQDGLLCFDTRKKEWVNEEMIAAAGLSGFRAIFSILPFDEEWLAIVCPSLPLTLLNRRTGAFKQYPYPGVSLRTAFQARSGAWLLGSAGGIIHMSEQIDPFPYYFFGKIFPPVFNNWQRSATLSADGRQLFLGTLRGMGLLIWDLETDTWQTASFRKPVDLAHTDLLLDALWVDPKGKLWIGSEDGLLERSGDPGKLRRVAGKPGEADAFKGYHILSICSRGDELWVGTNGHGLFSFDPETREIAPLASTPVLNDLSIVNKLLSDPAGRIWVGHDRGLSCFDTETGRWKHFQRGSSPLSHNMVTDLDLDAEGRLWVGTLGGGLNSVTIEKNAPWQFHLYRNQEVPGANVIYHIEMTSQGMLWIGCDSGLSRLDPKTGAFVNYDIRQGMFAKIGSLIQLPNGYILSGANRGFHYFHPDSITAGVSAPVPYLKEFRVFDQIRTPKGGALSPLVELKSNENYFSFQVGALNPTVYARNTYAYMLEGRDQNWFNSGERSYFSYTHLPAGHYRLLVRVANQHGQWSEVTPLLSVRIRPPFWQTAWFISGAVLALAGFAYLNYRFFRRQRQLRDTQRVIDYFASSTYPNLTVDAVLWDVARNCVGSMGFEDCVIYLVDEERQVLVQKAAYGPKSPQPYKIIQPLELQIGKGIVGTVAKTGKPVIVNDTSRDKRYIPDDQFRLSELAVPILDDGRVIGVIDTEHSQKRYFQPFHVRALTAIASVCAAKIAQAEAETAIREKERQLLEMDKHLAEAQLSALRAQMNPHFLFNSLNSINWYIIKNKPKEASKYLTKFSRLIRLILDHSKCLNIALTQELEALKLYLDIEAIRFEKKFEYEVRVDESLDTEELQIPPLILQPYVENAIWHGLMHSERPGRLLIEIRPNDGHLLCIIQDNGIGRGASEQLKRESIAPRDSKGMRITAERISLLNVNGNGESPVQIIDLYDADGSPTGTRVEIKLPLT